MEGCRLVGDGDCDAVFQGTALPQLRVFLLGHTKAEQADEGVAIQRPASGWDGHPGRVVPWYGQKLIPPAKLRATPSVLNDASSIGRGLVFRILGELLSAGVLGVSGGEEGGFAQPAASPAGALRGT